MHEEDSFDDQERQPEDPASPDTPLRSRASNTRAARSPSQSRENSEHESSKPDDSRITPGPPRGQPPPSTNARHPVHERCKNHAHRECRSTSCNRWHGKSNPKGAACRDHDTPGIWCERSYEVDGPGCPYSHESTSTKPHSHEHRRLNRTPPAQPPAPSSQKTCWYHLQPEGCRKGDYCDHRHSYGRLN